MGLFWRWLAPPPSFLWGGRDLLSRCQIPWSVESQAPLDGVASANVRSRVVKPLVGDSIRNRGHIAVVRGWELARVGFLFPLERKT
jgi:hypothetical protein